MALADTAKLVVDLSLKGNFAQGIGRVSRDLNKFDARLNQSETRAFRFGQQIGTGIRRSAALAAGGLAFLALNVEQGLDSLVKLEAQTEATNAAIKATKGIAGITASQVRRLAEEFENVNAIFGDEVIQSAENMLLAFTNIRRKAFKPALQAALDLAAGLGRGPEGLAGTARILGIALNDPTKGLGRLSKAGVQFTAAQIKRIKALQKEGKLYEAQAIILKEIQKRFGGRFAAFGGQTERKVAAFKDAIEDLQRTLAVGFLPVVSNVADALRTLLADPQVQADVAQFGKNLAGIFSKENIRKGAETIGNVVDAIRNAIGVIGPGLSTAASVIGKVLDAFSKLPPEVQQLAVGALVANKLTGGIITNLAGGIASAVGGLLKNFVSAGVNIEAGVVNVAGAGIPGGGAAGGAAVATRGIGTLGKLFLVGESIGLIIAVEQVREAISTGSSQQAATIHGVQDELVRSRPNAVELTTALHGVNQGIRDLQSNPLNVLVQGDALTQLQSMRSDLQLALQTRAGSPMLEQRHGEQQAGEVQVKGLNPDNLNRLPQAVAVGDSNIRQAVATADTNIRTAVATADTHVTSTTSTGLSNVKTAVDGVSGPIVRAIWAARPIVNVTNVQKTITIQERAGPSNGSYGGGHGH